MERVSAWALHTEQEYEHCIKDHKLSPSCPSSQQLSEKLRYSYGFACHVLGWWYKRVPVTNMDMMISAGKVKFPEKYGISWQTIQRNDNIFQLIIDLCGVERREGNWSRGYLPWTENRSHVFLYFNDIFVSVNFQTPSKLLNKIELFKHPLKHLENKIKYFFFFFFLHLLVFLGLARK